MTTPITIFINISTLNSKQVDFSIWTNAIAFTDILVLQEAYL